MSEAKHILPEDLNDNVFTSIGKDTMLISAYDENHTDKKIGTMTASWGGMGVLWGKNVFFCFVRPQRYTKEFIDAQDKITLSFFEKDTHRDALKLCGTRSGRDCDKLAEAKLTATVENGAVLINEARVNIIGRKLFASELSSADFLDREIVKACYPSSDFHTVYVCEIIDVLSKD